MSDDKTLSTMFQELSRGTVSLAVLLTTGSPTYGYSMVTDLQEAGLDVEQNTLYPLLRRMESQGLLESSWDTGDKRPRKYYRRTQAGRDAAVLLGNEWGRLNEVIRRLVKNEEENQK